MKIALVYLGRKGGGAVYGLEVARTLSTKLDILGVISKEVENIDAWRSLGIKLLEFDTYTDSLEAIIHSFNIGMFHSIIRQIKSHAAEVIYYPMVHIWTPILNVISKSIPTVITIHDAKPHKGEENYILKAVQYLSIKQASRIIVLSKASMKTLELMGINRNKIDVIPHGEFSYYTFGKDLINIYEADNNTLLFFGRILPYKGLDVLLEAFDIIKNEIPEARLLIVGSGMLDKYKEPLSKLEDVHLVNRWISEQEIWEYFARSAFVVLPYVDASQSGIIPLAYSFKKPVVATNVGGLAEQVTNGVTGYLVPAKNAAALARACVELLKNPNKRIYMGEAGYKKSVTEWNWDNIGEKIYQCCKSAARIKTIS